MKGFTKGSIVFIFLSRFRTSDVMFNYVRKYVAKQYTVYEDSSSKYCTCSRYGEKVQIRQILRTLQPSSHAGKLNFTFYQ